MKAILTNFGTNGDLEPFLALGVELRRNGHSVKLAFPPRFRGRVESFGFTFDPIGVDLVEVQASINHAWADGADLTQMQHAFGQLKEALPGAFCDLRRFCIGQDLLVAGPAIPVARMVNELTGIPFASVQMSNFGGTGSRDLAQLSRWLVNPLRAELGLPPLTNPLTLDANSPQLALYAISRHVRPIGSSWPPHYRVTGFFFLDDSGWQCSKELERFLADGEPPVVFTLGAMTDQKSSEALHDVFAQALRIAKCRGIFQGSSARLANADTHILSLGYAPHSWLFERARCIVHHGGSGTVASVFRSGLPSVFVPAGDIFDQHYWAELAGGLGCTPRPIPLSELDSKVLAERILEAVGNPAYAKCANVVGQKVRAESGVRSARQLVEELVHRAIAAGY